MGGGEIKVPLSIIFSFFLQFEGSRAISKPAPNPGTYRTLVETLSDQGPYGVSIESLGVRWNLVGVR